MSRSLSRSGFLVLALTAFALPACGSDDAGDASAGGSGYLETAESKLERAFSGTNETPPAAGPPAQRGKSVWIISCGQSLEGCSDATRAEQAAAEEVGWEVRVFDGKLDPATFNGGVRQAVAAGADGIILNTIDCPLVRAALQQAKREGVEVVGLYSLDCDEAVPGSPSLFTSVNYGPGGSSYTRYVSAWAAPRADWLISETGGQAKVIDFVQTDVPAVQLVERGFAAELEKCTGCKVVSRVTFSSADIGPRLQQKAEQAIIKNPEANAVHVPYDGAVVAGIGPAIVASGKSDRLAVMGGEGNATNVKLIAGDKGQDAANAVEVEWLGWAAVDTLNRVLAGQGAAPQGIGWQIVDRDHNIGEAGTYQVDVDFKSAYRKVWGQSE